MTDDETEDGGGAPPVVVDDAGRRHRTRVRLGVAAGVLVLVVLVAVAAFALGSAGDEGSDGPRAAAEGSGDWCNVLQYDWSPYADREGVDVVVFLEPGGPQDVVDAVGAVVEADGDVESHEYVDQEAAFQEFEEVFADSPGMVDSVDPSVLPTSFRLTLADGHDPGEVYDRYAALDGVRRVVVGEQRVRLLDVLVGGWLAQPRPTPGSLSDGVVGYVPDTAVLDDLEASAPDEVAAELEVVLAAMLADEELTTPESIDAWDAAQVLGADAQQRCGLVAADPASAPAAAGPGIGQVGDA